MEDPMVRVAPAVTPTSWKGVGVALMNAANSLARAAMCRETFLF
jgi:hypothetical protein